MTAFGLGDAAWAELQVRLGRPPSYKPHLDELLASERAALIDMIGEATNKRYAAVLDQLADL